MKYIFLLSAATLTLLGCSKRYDDPFAICSDFDATDRQMLMLIDDIKSKFSDDNEFLAEFNLEQVYWIQYRDHRLKSLYPKDWNRFYRKNYGKEVFNPCKCHELNRMTLLRIDELNLFLTGGPEGQEDCPSMFNRK